MNPWRRLRSLGAMVALGMVLVGATALAGIDSPGAWAAPGATTTSTTTPVTASTPLCQSVPHLDRLVVRRRDAFPQNQMRFSFRSEETVSHPRSVREVAEALCALPVFPGGVHCPVDLGIVYHLAFFASGQRFHIVSVDATGCQIVRGMGTPLWAARSPKFWHTLGNAMGLTKAGNATFQGEGPNG